MGTAGRAVFNATFPTLNFFLSSSAAEASVHSGDFRERPTAATALQSRTKRGGRKPAAHTRDIFERRDELSRQMNTTPEATTLPIVAGALTGAVVDTAKGMFGLLSIGFDATLSSGLGGLGALVPKRVQAAAQVRMLDSAAAIGEAVTNLPRTVQRVSETLGAEFKSAAESYEQGNYFTTGYNLRSFAVPPSAVGAGYKVARLTTRLGVKGVTQVSNVYRDFAATRDFISPLTLRYDAATRLNSGFPVDMFGVQTPWTKKAQIGDGIPRASSAADALRLKVQLSLQQGNILDASGKLTESALSNVVLLTKGEALKNQKVIAELIKDGSKIEEWAKYTTREAVLVNGQKIQVHFYMNETTGMVNHAMDYKSVPIVQAYKP